MLCRSMVLKHHSILNLVKSCTVEYRLLVQRSSKVQALLVEYSRIYIGEQYSSCWLCSVSSVSEKSDLELKQGVISTPSLLQKCFDLEESQTQNYIQIHIFFKVCFDHLISSMQVCWHYSTSTSGSGHRSRRYLPRT